MQPDPAHLSQAALDVRHELDQLARENPHASAPSLVLLLAWRYIPARLKRPRRMR